ncbi:MAG: hypothetical protein AAFQ53_06415 [Bacteroidota bacterium]
MSDSPKHRTPASPLAGVFSFAAPLLTAALVAGLLSACSPAGPLDGSRVATPPPTPTFTLLPTAPSYLAVATFRGEGAVALGDSAAVFEIGETVYRAPLANGPSDYEEPGGMTVTQATYTLDQDSYGALTTNPADSVSVQLPIGGAMLEFPFQRGDVVE